MTEAGPFIPKRYTNNRLLIVADDSVGRKFTILEDLGIALGGFVNRTIQQSEVQLCSACILLLHSYCIA